MKTATKITLIAGMLVIVISTSVERDHTVNQHLPTAAAGQVAMAANNAMNASSTVINTVIDVEHAEEKVDPAQTIG